MDDNTQFRRNNGFNTVFGERVIAEDVALHKVVDIQVGARVHHDIDRIEVVRHEFAREGINKAERAAEGVLFGHCGSGLLSGDKLHHNATLVQGIQDKTAVAARHIVIRLEVDLEEIRAIDTVLIADDEIDINILHRLALVTVIDGKRTLERLAGHGHLLGELDGNGGANRRRCMTAHIILSKIIKHSHGTVIHLIRMTESDAGSIRFSINGSIKINIVKHDAIMVVCGWQISIVEISLIPIIHTVVPSRAQHAYVIRCHISQCRSIYIDKSVLFLQCDLTHMILWKFHFKLGVHKIANKVVQSMNWSRCPSY